jgi:transposase
MLPFARHARGDRRMFQVHTAQFIEAGICTQAEVIRAFGVPAISVKRAVRRYRAEGVEAFFRQRRPRRSQGKVLTDEVLAAAQRLLNDGYGRREVAEDLGVKLDTLRKAIGAGRLHEVKPREAVADKSTRSVRDAEAAQGLGTACTRIGERVLAAVGRLAGGAQTRFEHCLDVPYGGALCALPALVENGLLTGAEGRLGGLRGYYRAAHVLLLMGLMALCRIRTVEQLRGESPGEFGKLLGLDRCPEVRCLRRKLDELCEGEAASRWAGHLGQQWLQEAPQSVGTLYVDGHVRVYHGSKTRLPRRYVSRQRLCLRGITDYWVNDALGLPFFVVEKVANAGLLEALREDIVPRLLREIPGQPTAQELEVDLQRCRFALVFDREGYSPAFFREMWQKHRIGCITYHKHPKGEWPAEEFHEEVLCLSNGEQVRMRLAERGSLVGTQADAMWMREVRKLTDGGHQVSLVSTAFGFAHTALAVGLFSRWSQENFLRYMMQHFAMDALGEHSMAPPPDTMRVVNPAWRELDRQHRSATGKLIQRHAKFAAVTLELQKATQDDCRVVRWQRQAAELLEQVEQCQIQLRELADQRRATAHYLRWEQLPEDQKFYRLAPKRHRLLETIRMIAYRAETAMVPHLRDEHADTPAVRTLLQDLFRASADIIPEPDHKRLRVRIHRASRPATDRRLQRLLDLLNETETLYPGTDLQLVYELAGGAPLAAASPPPDGITDASLK